MMLSKQWLKDAKHGDTCWFTLPNTENNRKLNCNWKVIEVVFVNYYNNNASSFPFGTIRIQSISEFDVRSKDLFMSKRDAYKHVVKQAEKYKVELDQSTDKVSKTIEHAKSIIWQTPAIERYDAEDEEDINNQRIVLQRDELQVIVNDLEAQLAEMTKDRDRWMDVDRVWTDTHHKLAEILNTIRQYDDYSNESDGSFVDEGILDAAKRVVGERDKAQIAHSKTAEKLGKVKKELNNLKRKYT